MKKLSKIISALLTVLMLTGTVFAAPAVSSAELTDSVAAEYEQDDLAAARIELDQTIRDAETYFMSSSRYTPESLNNLRQNILQAREVLINEKSTYDALVSAITSLENAIRDLVPSSTDTTELWALLEIADTYVETKDSYTAASYKIFNSALNNAVFQAHMGNVQSEIDRAVSDLKSAIAGLVLIENNDCYIEEMCRIGFAIYMHLNVDEMLNNENVSFHIYGTVDGCTVFRVFYNDGRALPCVVAEQLIGEYLLSTPYPYGPQDNPTGIYALIDINTVTSLLTAYEAGFADMDKIYEILKNDPDGSIVKNGNATLNDARDKLDISIKRAEVYLPDEELYQEDVFKDFKVALSYAKCVRDNELSSVYKINRAKTRLDESVEKLGTPAVVDKTGLFEIIGEAESYEGQEAKYTPRSFTRLMNVLGIARSVYEESRDQSIIDKSAENLRSAIDSLMLRDDDAINEIELCCRKGYAEINGCSVESELNEKYLTYEIFEVSGENYVFRRMGVCSPAMGYDRIGDYLSISYNLFGDDSNLTGLYVLDKFDKVVPLSVAAENGLVDMSEVAAVTSDSDHGMIRLIGDADGDSKLTIKDATFIQKYLAGFKNEIDKMTTDENYWVSDINCDKTLNIKDVTDIQKKLADLTI